MSGVSIGWFSTTMFHAHPPVLANALRRYFRRQPQGPLQVDQLSGPTGPAGAAYAMLNGGTPMQINSGGIEGAATNDVFTFVLEVSGRPAIMTAPFSEQNVTIWTGIAPPQAVRPLGLGLVELRAGMALHFDPSQTWHGFTSLPWAGQERAPAPHAVMLQIGGYAATDIKGAAEHMALILDADTHLGINL